MKKILVTGGAGFIGSHTCLLLLENGYEIHSIDSHINSYGKSLDLIKNIFITSTMGISYKVGAK